MNVKYPPLLLKYLKIYQDNPKSKIFAPLAEAYRKIGLVDEAIEICREGLSVHKDFISGKVALARAYFEKRMYKEIRSLLLPIIENIPDNLIAQRLLSDSCLVLGYVHEALAGYKMILYFHPDDTEVASLVQELEAQAYENGGLLRGFEHRPEKLKKLLKLQRILNKIQSYQLSTV